MLLATLLISLQAAAQTPTIAASKPDPMTLGPQVGQALPDFEAKDQNGRSWKRDALKGPKGLVFILFRSADWCPYCKGQLVELQQQVETLRAQGLGVAALSCDTQEILKDFSTRRGITYPLLSDPDSKIIRAFGLINEVDYPPGHQFHGIPYPGTFIVDEKGVITRKEFEKPYQERRTAASLLWTATAAKTTGGEEVKTDHFVVRVSSSNDEVMTGERITLALDFAVSPSIHLYAEGAGSYRPLALKLTANPFVNVRDARYPKARSYTFAPLKETVPVFEGSFRITQDVVIQPIQRNLAPSATPADQPTEIELAGAVEYQACSDTICYPPASVPVKWTLKVKALDRERVPEALRKKPQP